MPSNHYHSEPGNPIEELKSTKVWQYLEKLNSCKAKDMCNFVSYITPILNDIKTYFPLYTRHDAHHSYKVLDRMAQIINPNLFEGEEEHLFEDELLYLIVSAYTHDIGMALFEKGNEKEELLRQLKLSNDIEPTNQVLTDFLRKNHAERGDKFLRTEGEEYISQAHFGTIGLIIKGHNLEPENLERELHRQAAAGTKETDPMALTIILCCADILEFNDTRVLESAYNEALLQDGEASKKSLQEMKKHRSIRYCIAIEDGFIIMTGTFNDLETLHATHMALNQMEEWLKKYIKIASCSKRFKRGFLKIKNHKIKRDFTLPPGIKYYPIAIKIDEIQIRELFTSSDLWGREPIIALKELVQNAIDACRYREYISSDADDYTPQIEITFDIKNKELAVTDNGCGMTKEDIIEFFLQMGKSKVRSQNFRSNPVNSDFHPIARFGIGFWSVFTIADKASVETKSFDDKKGYDFEVSMKPVMRYLKLTQNNIKKGTSIKLNIKNGIDIQELLEKLNEVISAPPVPIIIKNNKGEILYKFTEKLSQATSEERFEYLNHVATNNGIKWFNYAYDTDNIEFRIGIAYSIIEANIRCLTPKKEQISSLTPSVSKEVKTYVKTYVCGLEANISFPYHSLPLDIIRVGILKINIKSPKGLNFSFYRKNLDDNERLEEIKIDIHKCMSQGLKSFYQTVGIINKPEEIKRVIDDSRS